MKTAIDNFSIEPPKKLSFRERMHLYALSKLVRALINSWPLRAAFWMVVLQAITKDSLRR